MQDLGYSDRNSFSALGTISLLIAWQFFKLFVVGFLKAFIVFTNVKHNFITKSFNWLINGLLINNMLTIFQEGMMEILYDSLMNYKTIDNSSWGEYLG